MQESEEKTQESQNKESFSDAVLCWLEIGIALLLSAAAIIAIVYEFFWIMFAAWPERHGRLASAFISIDSHWKAPLAILVPLFYRPARKFLLTLKKLGPAEAHSPNTAAQKQDDIPKR